MGLLNLFDTTCDMAEHTAIIKCAGSYTNYAAIMNNLNMIHEMQKSKQHAGCFIEQTVTTANPFKTLASYAEKMSKTVSDKPITMPKINLGDIGTDE